MKDFQCNKCGELFKPTEKARKACRHTCSKCETYLRGKRKEKNIKLGIFPKRKKHSIEYWKDVYSKRKNDIVYKKIKNIERRANRAVDRGELIKKPCEKCGNKIVDMHHDDYSKPFEVRFLCRSCHKKIHANENVRATINNDLLKTKVRYNLRIRAFKILTNTGYYIIFSKTKNKARSLIRKNNEFLGMDFLSIPAERYYEFDDKAIFEGIFEYVNLPCVERKRKEGKV